MPAIHRRFRVDDATFTPCRTARRLVACAALAAASLSLAFASTDGLRDRPVLAQRPTLTPRSTGQPKPTATPLPSPTPAAAAAPPSGDGVRERGARQVFVPLFTGVGNGDGNGDGNDRCTPVVSVFNAGTVETKAAFLTWEHEGGPVLADCSGLLKPGATWRFTSLRQGDFVSSGLVLSFNTRSLAEIAPGLGVDDIVGDYMCESLFYEVVANPEAYLRLREALVNGGEFKGVPLDRAMGGPLAVSVDRTCDTGVSGVTAAAEYGGTAFDHSLTAWSPALHRYRYALPALHGGDLSVGGQRSHVGIQNAGLATATIELLVAGDGEECGPPRTVFHADVLPGQTVTVAPELTVDATAGWVLGTQPLAVAVEATGAETLTAYEGAAAPPDAPDDGVDGAAHAATQLRAPLAYVGLSGWTSTLHLQNLSPDVAAKIWVGVLDATGDILTTGVHWVCPSGHTAIDLSRLGGVGPNATDSVRLESLEWALPSDPSKPPAGIAAVMEVHRRPADAPRDSEAGAYLVSDDQGRRSRFDDGASVLVVPDTVAGGRGDRTTGEVAVVNAVLMPGLTSVAVGLGAGAGLDSWPSCMSLNERQRASVPRRLTAAGDAPFRGATLVSAATWEHDVFDERGELLRNVVALDMAAIERPAGSLATDDVDDQDRPGDVTRIQSGLPVRIGIAGERTVDRTVAGGLFVADCPGGFPDLRPGSHPTPTPRPVGTVTPNVPTGTSRVFLPLSHVRIAEPPTPPEQPCYRPWRLTLRAAADGGVDAGAGAAPCNGRSDAADALAVASCPLPSFRAQIVRSSDAAVLWTGVLTADADGRSAVVEAVVCEPPPYVVSIFRVGGDAGCWRVCPGTPEVRSITQADIDAADPSAGPSAGRNATIGWGYDRVAAVAASQGAPLAYVPVLNFIGNDDVCVSTLTVQNAGADGSKAILVTFGAPGYCPPLAAGPLKVECSGLIRPGANWTFLGAQIPTGSKSGYVLSATTKTLAEIGADLGVDDIAADYLCEVLFFGIVGDPDDERRFRRDFLAGNAFQGLPLGRLYGSPLAIHVERTCDLALATDPPPVAADAYTALGHRTIDARPGDVAEYRYPLPALIADRQAHSFIYVQNAGLACADVDVRYRPSAGGGVARCASFTVAAGDAYSVDLAKCLAPSGPGAGLASPGVGWVTGTAPLAVVVDLTSGGDWPVLASYSAPPSVASAAQPLVAPLVLPSTPAVAHRARLFVQNLDPDHLARVHIAARLRDGDPAGVQPPDVDIDPGAGVAIDLDAALQATSLRVESIASPFRPDAPPAPIAAALLQWRPAGADGEGVRDAVIDTLTPAGAIVGTIRGLPVGVTRLAVPVLGREVPNGNQGVDTIRSSRLVLANRVETPGFTDIVLHVYDANGLLDYVCQKLNDRQIEYIDLDTWGYVNKGFRGSALVSALFWEHDVFDPSGAFITNRVDLDASLGWFGTGDDDDEALTHAVPISPDIDWPTNEPILCGSSPGPLVLVPRPRSAGSAARAVPVQ
ncbi:MAG: hypothetical protein ABI780_07860 [Ardenticatenales bacterium]